jgi:hypothetical protein
MTQEEEGESVRMLGRNRHPKINSIIVSILILCYTGPATPWDPTDSSDCLSSISSLVVQITD